MRVKVRAGIEEEDLSQDDWNIQGSAVLSGTLSRGGETPLVT